jgi:uncharacterized peroxidase-related enzyme
VLPLLYPDPDTRKALLADPETAPIPLLHRELFRFAEKFVRRSWEMTSQDLARLREADLPDSEIVHWASLGSTQSWFTMSADGGGVPLEDGTSTGSAVGRRREDYEAQRDGLLAASPGAGTAHPLPVDDGVSWTDLDETAEGYLEAADWARERYGCVPNLFRAVSLRPAFFRRHQLALELLEAPQSESLSARQHAMVRVLVSNLNRSRYSEPTSTALWLRVGGEPALFDRLREDPLGSDWSAEDRAVLTLATKFARNTYKTTEKDAVSLREVGLDDEAYVDILNTVSIQTSLDRLANALGVQPDATPLLPSASS